MKKQATLMETPASHAPRAGGGGRVITKAAQYVGSFLVEEAELQQKVQAVHEQLRNLKDCPRRRPVALTFCLQGLKMYSAEMEVLLMAHALRRIFFSTCRPADGQFAFVSRNPRSLQLFGHVFVGSQPCEVQTLHFLLCRCFQLCFLRGHPEAQGWPSTPEAAPEAGRLLGAQVMWESLDPEEVSQNVNALVSFQRLLCPADFGPSVSVSERLDLEGRGRVGGPRPGNPYCSPILVRKKAIRSKILRSGAYRGCTFDAPFQPCAQETLRAGCDADNNNNKGSKGAVLHLPEDESSLMEDVWSFAGIGRDAGMALLRRDVLGAFLLWAEPGAPDQWCLSVRTRCGAIPYQVYQSQVGKFSVEHLNVEFPSMEALLQHYAGTQGGLFCSLESGRVNHGYEEREQQEEGPPRGGRRKASWLQGGSKSLAVP